jgi:hypothetical protein
MCVKSAENGGKIMQNQLFKKLIIAGSAFFECCLICMFSHLSMWLQLTAGIS